MIWILAIASNNSKKHGDEAVQAQVVEPPKARAVPPRPTNAKTTGENEKAKPAVTEVSPPPTTIDASIALTRLVQSSAAEGLSTYRIAEPLEMDYQAVTAYLFFDAAGKIVKVAVTGKFWSGDQERCLVFKCPGKQVCDSQTGVSEFQQAVTLQLSSGSPPLELNAQKDAILIEWVSWGQTRSYSHYPYRNFQDALELVQDIANRSSYSILVDRNGGKCRIKYNGRTYKMAIKTDGKWSFSFDNRDPEDHYHECDLILARY